MTITKAANELIARGIVKPTPIRGRYRFTELGLQLYPDKMEYLSYTRQEILEISTTNDNGDYMLNQVVKDQRVIVEFKTVSIARKTGYTASISTTTRSRRTRRATATPRVCMTRKSKFKGWSYTLKAYNLTETTKKLMLTVYTSLISNKGIQRSLDKTLYLNLDVVDRGSEDLLHSLLAVKLNKAASIQIEAHPLYS